MILAAEIVIGAAKIAVMLVFGSLYFEIILHSMSDSYDPDEKYNYERNSHFARSWRLGKAENGIALQKHKKHQKQRRKKFTSARS